MSRLKDANYAKISVRRVKKQPKDTCPGSKVAKLRELFAIYPEHI